VPTARDEIAIGETIKNWVFTKDQSIKGVLKRFFPFKDVFNLIAYQFFCPSLAQFSLFP